MNEKLKKISEELAKITEGNDKKWNKLSAVKRKAILDRMNFLMFSYMGLIIESQMNMANIFQSATIEKSCEGCKIN